MRKTGLRLSTGSGPSGCLRRVHGAMRSSVFQRPRSHSHSWGAACVWIKVVRSFPSPPPWSCRPCRGVPKMATRRCSGGACMCPVGPWRTCVATRRWTGIAWNQGWGASVSSARRSSPPSTCPRTWGRCQAELGAGRAGVPRHHRRSRLSLGSIRCPVSLPESLGNSVGRFCPRSAGLGCRGGAGDGQDRWLASHARRLAGPVHPHHGAPVLSPGVAHHPCSRHHNTGRCGCAGPNAGVEGVSRPEPTGFFPASAALEGLGPDGTACRCDAEPYPGVVRKTCSGQ
jgi:hypothetical protein